MTGLSARRAVAPRVLVVDDDPLVIELIREVLGQSGKRVLTALSPDEALRVLAAKRVDLVLTDIRMPGHRSGFDLLQELRELYPSLPVLLVTGTARGEASLTEALDRGAAGFVTKPFTQAQLCAKVEQALQHQQHAEAEVRERIVRPTIATALANAIEVKDAGMEGHVERLGEIALALGRRLDLSRHELESLELGAVLHDIGKIGIPDAILLKPGPLDDAESEVMRAHVVIGDQMLRHLDLDEIRPIIRHHHERWDGDGYPDKLVGEGIPILARIVSVADSIEAMSAHRVYRAPLPPSEVCSELAAGRGSQWDPRIVDLALELIERGSITFDARGPVASPPFPLSPPDAEAGSADRLFGPGSELLRALTAHSQVGVFVSNTAGDCIYVNEGWCELAGISAEQALGRGWAAALHPDDRDRVHEQWAAEAEKGGDSAAEYRFLLPDGSVSWIHGFASALRDEQGALRGWIGTCLDLTARREAEDAVAQANERFGVAFHSAPIGMALVLPDGRFLQVNDALCRLLGYTPSELEERTFFDVTHPDDLEASAARRKRQLSGAAAETRLEKRYLRSDGETVWVAVSSSMVHDSTGEPLYSVAQIEDIAERKGAEQQLRFLADHDPLTGLLNRRRFNEDLEREGERLLRHRDRLAALLLLDVDRFKRTNDTLGHHAGDDVLKAIAQALTHRLRATDVIGRVGGDEFAALIVDLKDERDGRKIAKELAEDIRSQTVLTCSGRASVTVSIGVAVLDSEMLSRGDDLLVAADNALYRAKRAGRDRVSQAA